MDNKLESEPRQNSATTVAICTNSEQLVPITQRIAHRLQLNWFLDPLTDNNNIAGKYDYLLVVKPNIQFNYQLEIKDASDLKYKLFIDFCAGNMAYRARHGGGRNQALARAIGLKNDLNPTVLDATAGLGRDAFILANLGCNIYLIERSSVVFCLLQDGIRRATQHANKDHWDWINERMQLLYGDAQRLIPEFCVSNSVDVIYLDPMYPQRSKSALVKKEMRFLQALLGKDLDADQLLAIALKNARKRVVVKRPRSASYLGEKPPSHTIETKTTRFDVYMNLG